MNAHPQVAAGADRALLEVRGLSVSYGKVEALHDANLRLMAGQIVTVIGPNGAGKTTMLGAIMGQLPAVGSVSFLGQDQAGIRVERRVDTTAVQILA